MQNENSEISVEKEVCLQNKATNNNTKLTQFFKTKTPEEIE
jgi:hypothetical protein